MAPTSNRCDNCRKRKKKCSEQKPSCSECIRSGWVCPGYAIRWKFVDESPRLAEHYAGRKYVFDDIGIPEETCSLYLGQNLSLNGIVVAGKNLPLLQYSSDKPLKALTQLDVPRHLESNPLGTALVFCLESKVKGPLIPLRLIGSFFDFLPARLGRNTALDAAVSCLCAIYRGEPSPSGNFHQSVYQGYVRALSSLRSCLGDVSLRMESETLCASILLHMCELVVNVDRGGWSELARGTAFLLYSRGVDRYRSAFDYAILESQLGFVLAQAVGFKEHCFLRAPEWQALLSKSPNWPYQSLQPQSLSLRSRLSTLLADLPSLIIYSSASDKSPTVQANPIDRLDLLIQNATIILRNIKEWITVEADPLFFSCAVSEQRIREQVIYPDIISSISDCVAHTALINVDKILHSLWYKRLQSSSSEKYREQIFEDPKTIEQWQQRALMALQCVQKESVLAAKPLDFGLQKVQFNGEASAPQHHVRQRSVGINQPYN